MAESDTAAQHALARADKLNRDSYIQITEEHRHLLYSSKQLRIQLQRWMDWERKESGGRMGWRPSTEVVELFIKLSGNVTKLIAEGRLLAKSRAAGDLADDVLDSELNEVFAEEHLKLLDAMSIEQLEEVIAEKRELAATADVAPTP